MLGIGRTAVYELMRAGEIRSVRIGRSRRIPVSELRRMVAQLLDEGNGSDPARLDVIQTQRYECDPWKE